mmetsp:Transcript_6296/g.15102  ORF Transcript_6296/g.15102 Transcript_6296/m.15102 type:complete len:615 (+) Transcript_6296:73-1917(+)
MTRFGNVRRPGAFAALLIVVLLIWHNEMAGPSFVRHCGAQGYRGYRSRVACAARPRPKSTSTNQIQGDTSQPEYTKALTPMKEYNSFRLPLPPKFDEVEPRPRWKVLMDAVKDCEADEAVVPEWKLKPKLGIYSPTPQYAIGFQPFAKPIWQKAKHAKRKMKNYYRKMLDKRMEALGHKSRYMPDPTDKLSMAGVEIDDGAGLFKEPTEYWQTLKKMPMDDLLDKMDRRDQQAIRLELASKSVPIHERPGFQILARKQMKALLQRIDVIVEVRDARIPWVTAHPDIPSWVRPKPRVIVLTKSDLVPQAALEETIARIKASEADRGVPVVAVDAQRGSRSFEDLKLELMKAGAAINRRRQRKGVNPRAVRVSVVGLPNVGKSAVINQIMQRKVAKVTAWAGATKKVTWHKIGGFRNTEFEFLDTPGQIPWAIGKRFTEEQTNLLCMCRIFGERIIDREQSAYKLVKHMHQLAQDHPHLIDNTVWRETERIYGVDFKKAVKLEGPFLPDFVPIMNPEPFCGKVLNDFNTGQWGKVQLEAPPRWTYVSDQDRPSTKSALATEYQEQMARRSMRQDRVKALAPPGRELKLPTAGRLAPREPERVEREPVPVEVSFEGW